MVKYLIDSDILIDFFNNKSKAVQLITSFDYSELAISVVTVAEILEGLVDNPEKFRSIRGGLSKLTLFNLDWDVAEKFSIERAKLRKAGKLIENMDIFIAATALVNNLVLITGNKKDFGEISELKIYQD